MLDDCHCKKFYMISTVFRILLGNHLKLTSFKFFNLPREAGMLPMRLELKFNVSSLVSCPNSAGTVPD